MRLAFCNRTLLVSVMFAALLFMPSTTARPSSRSETAKFQEPSDQRDGQHDFDFNIGSWKTHIKYLHYPPSGSPKWAEMNGTVVVRKLWDGRGSIEEIEADRESGHFEGITLFLYNPQTHQWSQTFANSNNGTLTVPLIGSFKNGRGELLSQQPFHGRVALLRAVWSEINPNSHHFEEFSSDDAGKTWQLVFDARLTREK